MLTTCFIAKKKNEQKIILFQFENIHFSPIYPKLFLIFKSKEERFYSSLCCLSHADCDIAKRVSI